MKGSKWKYQRKWKCLSESVQVKVSMWKCKWISEHRFSIGCYGMETILWRIAKEHPHFLHQRMDFLLSARKWNTIKWNEIVLMGGNGKYSWNEIKGWTGKGVEFGYLHGMEWIKRMDKRRCGILSPSWLQFPPPAHFSRNAHRGSSPPTCTLQPGGDH